MPNLAKLNQMAFDKAEQEFMKCCGSKVWAEKMAMLRPYADENALFSAAEKNWMACTSVDWYEAFAQHPRIGGRAKGEWTKEEQAGMVKASPQTLEALQKGNDAYEKKFGYVFLVCATGKGAEEMLRLLRERLENEPRAELAIAVREQTKITRLRLEKWLQS